MGLEEVILKIGERAKRFGFNACLFDEPFKNRKGISLKEDPTELKDYMLNSPSRRYFIFGLGNHNAWKKIQNPLKTEYKGIITSFVGILSPSPNLNIHLLRHLGANIEEPPKGLSRNERDDLQVSISPYCAFDCFFPELTKIGYGTQIGLQTIIATHANQGEYWVVGGVDIGKNVIIGAKSVIAPGVKIGDYAKINTGSYVYDDVPRGVIFGGDPARKRGERTIRTVVIENNIPEIRAYKIKNA